MPDELKVEMREYGAKYPVLCTQLGLPGDNRAEHGYRNRGDAMDFSPLLLEKYLSASQEIVNTPDLPNRSQIFTDLIGVKQTLLPVQSQSKTDLPTVALSPTFAPERETMPEAKGNSLPLAEFRAKIAAAHADGLGGVFSVPKAIANKTIAGKGGLLKTTFGTRSLTVNPNADLWLATFSTAQATSAPAILTNKEKAQNSYELTFDIVSDDVDEGIQHLAFCAIGRKCQRGPLKLTAVLTDATEQQIPLEVAEGEAGTTFVSFSAHGGESIKKLIVDGTGIKGDYILIDDVAVITNGVKQTLLSVLLKTQTRRSPHCNTTLTEPGSWKPGGGPARTEPPESMGKARSNTPRTFTGTWPTC